MDLIPVRIRKKRIKEKEKENQGQKLKREWKSAIDRGRKQTETKKMNSM